MGIRLKGQTSGYVEIKAPATAADNTLTFPNGNGSNGQILTTDGSGNLSFSNPADTDKITEGNTEAEVVDSGSDGHFKVTTEGSERVRVGPAGQIGIGGANYGSTGQVLTSTGGSSAASWSNVEISSDTSPQLGGHLDVNGNDIVTTSNGDIDLDPNGSGQVVFKGNATRGSGAVKLNCENNSHGILVKGPPHSAGANYTLTLPNDTGTSGQLLSTNGSGVTSWTTVDASPTFQATADGALTDGMPVVITSSGNVKSAARVVTEHTPSVTAAESGFEGGQTRNMSTAYMTDQNVHFVAYCDQDDNNRGKIIPITINSNGSSMSFGADFTFDSSPINSTEVVYDPVNDIVGLCYTKTNGDLQFRIGKLTGTQGSGSESFNNLDTLQIDTSVSDKVKMFAHPDGGFVVFYTKNNTIKTEVVTVTNGDSLTGGYADGHIAMGHDAYFGVSYDGTDKYVIWWGQGSSAPGNARAAKHTGTGTSRRVSLEGSTTQFESDQIHLSGPNQAAYDAKADRHVFSYRNQDDSEDLYAIACERSSSGTLTFGTAVEYETNSNENGKLYYDPFAEKVFVIVCDNGDNDLEYRKFTISGSSITVGSPTTIRGQDTLHYDIAFSTIAQRWLLVARPSSSGVNGSASAIQISTAVSSLTTENYIGISNGAYSNGATATVQIVGSVDDAQSGLTPGQSYFVQDDGSLGLTADATVGSVFAGTAVSATKLIVKG